MVKLCRQFKLHPNQISEWKRQLLEHAADAFGGGTEAAEPVDLAPLHAKIGELTLENDFLEGALTKAGLLSVRDAKLIRSMSRKGCSPDNAACEGFFGSLKTELFYPRDWQATTIEQFIQVVDSYIRWYNEKRIKISLGSLSPLEYRASLGLTA